MAAPGAFRSKFGDKFMKKVLEWFPGHMGKGLKQLQMKLKDVDCIIEVHDARIPFSGRNDMFRNTLLGVRPHIFVLNKCDLIRKDMQPVITESIAKYGFKSDVLFTDCRTAHGDGVKNLLPTILNKISNRFRYNREGAASYNLLVIGVPNVGKSSLINVMRNYHARKKNATRVGPIAGITRSVLNKIQVSYDPPLYLLDSPGILEPNVKSVEAGFRLALCASMQDHLVGIINIADYLLYWLNKNGHFSYVEQLGLTEPCDDITEVLTLVALMQKKFIKLKDPTSGQIKERPHLESAALHFVRLFRFGELGQFILDADILHAASEISTTGPIPSLN